MSALGNDGIVKYEGRMNLDPYLTLFSVENPISLAETPRAELWRVERHDGPAVLKVFSARGLKVGDTIGTRLLRLWDGDGAVRLIDESEDAILMEWLDGKSLAATVRKGQDAIAAQVIAEISLKLHRPPADGYIALEDHFGGALLSTKIESFPKQQQPAFARAQALLQWLLVTTESPKLMHGDLNFDNIIQSDRGWLAIDPKGIIADPCYEFAVVFRNPTNEPDRVATPERMLELARLFALHTNLGEERILQFGFAHVAMSLAYHFRRASTLSKTDLAIFTSFDGLSLSPPS
jgi:streptomycin 6-kinase